MPQLVGLPCSMCGERISSAFESAFCEKCGNPVHNRCRAPVSSFPAPLCAVCGTNLDDARRAAEERERQRRAEEAQRPPPPPLEIARYVHYYRLAKLFLSAVFSVSAGIIVLTLEEPGTTAAGVGAIIAGLVLGSFVLLGARG